MATFARVLVLASLAAPVTAQQWAFLSTAGSAGVGVAEAPFAPTIVLPFPFGASRALTCVDGVFRGRVDAMPVELGGAQAATYDAMQKRVVVYAIYNGAASVCVFDGARWSVLPTTNPPPPRNSAALAYDAVSGKVVLFGGGVPTSFGAPLGDTWLLDGDTWTQLVAPGPPPRRNARMAPALLPSGFGLLLFGGNGQFGGGPFHFDDTWAFDGSTWTQLFPAAHPPAREAPAMAFDGASATTLLYGGRAVVGISVVPVGDAWTWNGTDWVPQSVPAAPALGGAQLLRDGARLVLVGVDPFENATEVHAWQGGWTRLGRGAPDVFGESLAFDGARAEVIRFGGRDWTGATYRGDTWLWDGAWRATSPTVTPPGRERAALAWHAPSGHAVLFGGSTASSFLGDTWLWDGTDWLPVTPPSAPGPRNQATAAYDPTRATVVLFGGANAAAWLDDTWEWNGATWSPLATTQVPPARPGRLAFDEGRQVLALYVGGGPAPTYGELWELHPTGWTQVSVGAPNGGDLVYDPITGRLALFATIGVSSDYDAASQTWQPRNQARVGPVVHDPTRATVLTVGQNVYASVLVPAAASVYGQGCGPAGEVTCSFDRRPAFDAPATVWVRTGDPVSAAFLFFGTAQQSLPFGGGCSVHIDGLLFSLAALASADGWAAIDLVIPTVPGTLGLDVFAQTLTLHANDLGFSNGVALRLGL